MNDAASLLVKNQALRLAGTDCAPRSAAALKFSEQIGEKVKTVRHADLSWRLLELGRGSAQSRHLAHAVRWRDELGAAMCQYLSYRDLFRSWTGDTGTIDVAPPRAIIAGPAFLAAS